MSANHEAAVSGLEVIPECLTVFIPGRDNDLLLIDKVINGQNKNVVFLGNTKSGKSSLADNCFRGIAQKSTTSDLVSVDCVLSVLQSFGSIQFKNHPFSDRAISFISCIFDKDDQFIGANVSLLALEVSRVQCTISDGNESNFFIFHDICSFVSDKLRNELQLTKLTIFQDSENFSDNQRHTSFLKLFDHIESGEASMESFLRLMAGIMHLREAKISAPLGDDTADTPVDVGDLTLTANLLGLPLKAISAALGARKVAAGRRASSVVIQNTAEQTIRGRDVLVKQLYRTAMQWCLKLINRSADSNESFAESYMNLVNIPGYEAHSKMNSLYQLCRNFASELLFTSMRTTLFESEKSLLLSQGLDYLWTDVELPVVTDVLSILSSPGRGLLPLLDVQTQLGDAASDKSYLSQTRSHLSSNTTSNSTTSSGSLTPPPATVGVYSKPRFGEDNGFVIRHYFGSVEYTVKTFVETNSEVVHKAFLNTNALLEKSNNVVLRDVYVDKILLPKTADREEGDELPVPATGTSTSRGKQGGMLVKLMDLAAEQYRSDFNMCARVVSETKLVMNILETAAATAAQRVHYILCCAPNEKFPKTRTFTPEHYQKQLHLYLVDQASLSRQAYEYPFRAPLTNLAMLSKPMALLVHVQAVGPRFLTGQHPSSSPSPFPAAHLLDSNEYLLGPTHVFLKQTCLPKIAQYATAIRSKCATVLQAFFRRTLYRLKFNRTRGQATRLASVIRGYQQRQKFCVYKAYLAKCATRIMSLWRKYVAVKSYQTVVTKVIVVQSVVRRYVYARYAVDWKAMKTLAVISVQAVYRGYVVKKQYKTILMRRAEVVKLAGGDTLVLQSNEQVAMAGVVRKEGASWGVVGGKKRTLVLLDSSQPRLLYFDSDKNRLKGSVPLSAHVQVTAVGDRKFEVGPPAGKKFKFHTVGNEAQVWSKAIQAALRSYVSPTTTSPPASSVVDSFGEDNENCNMNVGNHATTAAAAVRVSESGEGCRTPTEKLVKSYSPKHPKDIFSPTRISGATKPEAGVALRTLLSSPLQQYQAASKLPFYSPDPRMSSSAARAAAAAGISAVAGLRSVSNRRNHHPAAVSTPTPSKYPFSPAAGDVRSAAVNRSPLQMYTIDMCYPSETTTT